MILAGLRDSKMFSAPVAGREAVFLVVSGRLGDG